jgi:hypothetical protein
VQLLAPPIAVFTQRNLVESQLRKHSASIAVHACFHPCQVPAGAEPGLASNNGRQVPDSGARHLLGLSQDLLAMMGVRCSIPVPGTCGAEPGFASNAGRQVPDSGARHLLGLSQDLLAMLGVRYPIPVPGTCWGRARIC